MCHLVTSHRSLRKSPVAGWEIVDYLFFRCNQLSVSLYKLRTFHIILKHSIGVWQDTYRNYATKASLLMLTQIFAVHFDNTRNPLFFVTCYFSFKHIKCAPPLKFAVSGTYICTHNTDTNCKIRNACRSTALRWFSFWYLGDTLKILSAPCLELTLVSKRQ